MEKTRRLLLKAAGAVGAAGVLSAARPDTGAAQAPLQIPARAGTNPADLILTNGKIITVDPAFTIAQAIAIAGDRILAVGPDAAMAAMAGPATRVVDLKGKAVIPGITDGHAHMDREALRNVFPALGPVRSIRDIQDRIAELAQGQAARRMDRDHADRRSALLFRRAREPGREALADAAGTRRGGAGESGLHPLHLGLLARHLSARVVRQHRGAQARRHHPRHGIAGRHCQNREGCQRRSHRRFRRARDGPDRRADLVSPRGGIHARGSAAHLAAIGARLPCLRNHQRVRRARRFDRVAAHLQASPSRGRADDARRARLQPELAGSGRCAPRPLHGGVGWLAGRARLRQRLAQDERALRSRRARGRRRCARARRAVYGLGRIQFQSWFAARPGQATSASLRGERHPCGDDRVAATSISTTRSTGKFRSRGGAG